MKYLLLLVVVGVAMAGPTALPVDKCKNYGTHNVRHEMDCHMYYKCLKGIAFLMECPTIHGIPLVFNEQLGICDYEGVACAAKPSSTTEEIELCTSTPSPKAVALDVYAPPDCSKEPNKKKPHEDCHKFWYCTGEIPLVGVCKEGTNFNPKISECDWVECRKV